ncbi:MAG TPA: cbb3-type cytochrome oxidase assembly protein CcoS [Rubrivivax sp.]|nr:cbb3-type cytochrome oxidase assembly protein CcoS [Rubrivivax sp.]HPP82456.1 cbb3-type cytochrome oxidase assembly protein CcoS [Rubrivivax sp.]
MNILVVMIPLSIVLLVGAGIAFFWAVEHEQFDDLDSPAILPLLDDPAAKASGAAPTAGPAPAAARAPEPPVRASR